MILPYPLPCGRRSGIAPRQSSVDEVRPRTDSRVRVKLARFALTTSRLVSFETSSERDVTIGVGVSSAVVTAPT